jgi:hypothetical protein
MAMVMCEDFVDQRVGTGELEHLSPVEAPRSSRSATTATS